MVEICRNKLPPNLGYSEDSSSLMFDQVEALTSATYRVTIPCRHQTLHS
jgi:hypothetical protein